MEISTAVLLSGIPFDATQSFLELLHIETNHQTTSSRLVSCPLLLTSTCWLTCSEVVVHTLDLEPACCILRVFHHRCSEMKMLTHVPYHVSPMIQALSGGCSSDCVGVLGATTEECHRHCPQEEREAHGRRAVRFARVFGPVLFLLVMVTLFLPYLKKIHWEYTQAVGLTSTGKQVNISRQWVLPLQASR